MKPSVTFRDTTIAWTERGQGDPVLLLHPLFFSGSIFDAVSGRIAQHGYRVVAPDLPGHGESKAPSTRFDLDAMAATMAEFIAARSLERCHIVGLSLGGMIALRLAVRWPDLVRSMILMGAAAAVESSLNRRRHLFAGALASCLGPGTAARWMGGLMLAESTREGPRGPMLMSTVESAIRANPRRRMMPLIRALVDRGPVEVEARRSIESPVLAIVGKEDRIRSIAETRAMAAPIHGSAVVELPLCGHLPVLEQPAPSVTLILRFLGAADRLAGPAPTVSRANTRMGDGSTTITR